MAVCTVKDRIAFFDIDGTFLRSSLLIELVRGLVRRGTFPKLTLEEIAQYERAWRERRAPYAEYIRSVVQTFYRRVNGCTVFDVEFVGTRVAEELHHEVYVYTRAQIERLRPTHMLVAITGSPVVIADPFCRQWGFDIIRASPLVSDGGIYRGNVPLSAQRDLNIADYKREIMDGVLAEVNRGRAVPITYEGSVAVGDTESDAPLLERVADPVAFNPNDTLRRLAHERMWRIVVERKDAIYEIHDGRVQFWTPLAA